jgi:hypothetical protein
VYKTVGTKFQETLDGLNVDVFGTNQAEMMMIMKKAVVD